jgi:hypothetical protein
MAIFPACRCPTGGRRSLSAGARGAERRRQLGAQRSTDAPRFSGTASMITMSVGRLRLITAPRRTRTWRKPARLYAVNPAMFHSGVSRSTLHGYSTLKAKASTSSVASVAKPWRRRSPIAMLNLAVPWAWTIWNRPAWPTGVESVRS